MADIVQRKPQGRNNALTHLQRDPFARLQDVFDNFFAPIMRQWSGPLPPEMAGMRFWNFDVDTNENEVVVRAEMPGFEPDDIDVSVEESVLAIRAERRTGSDEERGYRSFYQTTVLPAGIEAQNVKATYRNGVLELHIPRKEEAKPKRIRVQGQANEEAKPGEIEPQKTTDHAAKGEKGGGQSTNK